MLLWAYLRILRQMRSQSKMMDFHIGEKVSFEGPHGKVSGTLTRFNKKTVTVITDDGHQGKSFKIFADKI